MTARVCCLEQEWASQNQVNVPQKEGRVNASQLYKGGDEDAPTNILQVRRACSEWGLFSMFLAWHA